MEPDESTALAGQRQRLEPLRHPAGCGELDGPFEERPLFVPARGAVKTSAGLVDGFSESLQVTVGHTHQFSFLRGSPMMRFSSPSCHRGPDGLVGLLIEAHDAGASYAALGRVVGLSRQHVAEIVGERR
jgi:hypothetical protein